MNFSTVKGMRDFSPELARKKLWIEDTFRRVSESYGFEPLETPVLENLELLNKKEASGEDVRKELYAFKDKSGRDIGLRFDLTVPMARFIAGNPQIAKPFKRYQIGKCYRYDRPQAFRYREFSQADADIVGVAGMLAEFEIIALSVELMKELGIGFKIKINNRKLLEEVCLGQGVEKQAMPNCIRILDKLEKIGKQEAEKELKKNSITPKVLSAVSEKNISKLPDCDGKKELLELFALLKENGLENFVELDLGLARGLDYYTGTVFEVVSSNGPSIAGGGRYDRLIENFGGQKTPAVGISFGVDRIIDLLPEKKISNKTVFVVPVGNAQKQALKIATSLRTKGIAVNFDFSGKNISKSLEYARKNGMRIVLLLGEEELKNKSVTLRDMETGKQETVRQNEIVQELKKMLV